MGLAQFGFTAVAKADDTATEQSPTTQVKTAQPLQQPEVSLSTNTENNNGSSVSKTDATATQPAADQEQPASSSKTDGTVVQPANDKEQPTSTNKTDASATQSSTDNKDQAAPTTSTGNKTGTVNTEQSKSESGSVNNTNLENSNKSTADDETDQPAKSADGDATVSDTNDATDNAGKVQNAATGTSKTADTVTNVKKLEQGSPKSGEQLPEGFSVSDPDYNPDSYAASVKNTGDHYVYYEGKLGNYHLDLETSRTDPTDVVLVVSQQNGTGWNVLSTTPITGASYTDSHTGAVIYNDTQSVYIKHTGLQVVSNVYGKLSGDGNNTYSGDVVIKPMKQEQTTKYVDGSKNEIADPITMKGLSGQKYTTKPSTELKGYTPQASSNANGYMSPFTADGQVITEIIHRSSGTNATVTYTVTDLNAGTHSC